jgi:hypothetical protein
MISFDCVLENIVPVIVIVSPAFPDDGEIFVTVGVDAHIL